MEFESLLFTAISIGMLSNLDEHDGNYIVASSTFMSCLTGCFLISTKFSMCFFNVIINLGF